MWQSEWSEIPEDEWPIVNKNNNWVVRRVYRLSACDNRPGLKMIYVTVLDNKGARLSGVKIRMDVQPTGTGTAFDHPNIWQLTGSREGRKGYWEWNHLGIPTRYVLWMGSDEIPLIENIRVDLGYEYCNKGRWPWDKWGYNSINRPGVYSYRIEIQRK